jgi:hypothetical protein
MILWETELYKGFKNTFYFNNSKMIKSTDDMFLFVQIQTQITIFAKNSKIPKIAIRKNTDKNGIFLEVYCRRKIIM